MNTNLYLEDGYYYGQASTTEGYLSLDTANSDTHVDIEDGTSLAVFK